MNNNSIIGNTYNYLTVLRRVGDHVTSGGNKFLLMSVNVFAEDIRLLLPLN